MKKPNGPVGQFYIFRSSKLVESIAHRHKLRASWRLVGWSRWSLERLVGYSTEGCCCTVVHIAQWWDFSCRISISLLLRTLIVMIVIRLVPHASRWHEPFSCCTPSETAWGFRSGSNLFVLGRNAEGGAAGNWDLEWGRTSAFCSLMLRVRPVEWVQNQAVVSQE